MYVLVRKKKKQRVLIAEYYAGKKMSSFCIYQYASSQGEGNFKMVSLDHKLIDPCGWGWVLLEGAT